MLFVEKLDLLVTVYFKVFIFIQVGEDFIIRKYAKIFCIEGKLKRSFFYEATVESEHNPNFKNYIQHVKDKKKLGNSVIIDKVSIHMFNCLG